MVERIAASKPAEMELEEKIGIVVVYPICMLFLCVGLFVLRDPRMMAVGIVLGWLTVLLVAIGDTKEMRKRKSKNESTN